MKIDDLKPPVAVPEPAWKQQLVEFWKHADDVRKIDLQVLLKMGDGDGARRLIESWQQEVVERRKKKSRKSTKKKRQSAPVRYAWGGYWTPGYNFGGTELGGEGGGDGGGGGESVREDGDTGIAQGSMIGDAGAQSTWDGVSPSTQEFLSEGPDSAVEDFVKFCAKELNIGQLPKLRLRRDPAWSERNHSFGQFDPDRGELNVSVAGRHIMDIFRTVAHELVHYRQNEQKELPADAGETGSRYENEANAQAGVLMRNYAQLHPEYFEDGVVAESSGYIPTEKEKNDPRFKMALSPDVRPGATGKNANKMALKTGPQGEPQLLIKGLKNALREFKETGALNVATPTPAEIAKKHDVALKQIQQQLAKGIEVEQEHTTDAKLAREIALDHLNELPDYYTRLSKVEPVNEDEDLFEIDMSPSNLRKLVRDIDARAGIEFEMIVPNVRVEDEDLEPDYDTDERVDSIEEAYDFFFDGDYNSRGDVNRLKSSMLENYYIWRDEQLSDQWDREGLDYLRDYIDRDDLFDRDEATITARDQIMNANPDMPVDSDEFQDLVSNRVDELADEFVESEWEDQGRIYDDAREQFDEEMGDTYDESDWLRSENIRYMSDITNFYSSDVQWPYYRSGGDGEMDIDAVANSFEEAIDRPVNAASSYHGARREAGTYVVEPDGSLVGDDSDDGGLEFVSPPLPLDELLSDMEKVRAWAKQRGCYTNNSTGLHMNVSVPNTSTAKLDYVKLALLLGDEHVLNEFGRASNTYAGSALKKIREILKNNPGSAAEVLNKMRDHMEALATKVIHSGETQKFTSINTKGDYVEFRSPGGDWLDANWDKVTPTLLRTVVALDAAMDPNKYRQEYQKKLYKLLDSSQQRLASPNVNKLLSMYFTADSEGGSREVAVQLAKELLVKRDPSRKGPEPKPADGQPAAAGSGRWGLWITGLGKFARRGDERLEFDSREAARDWYADQAIMRPGIRSDVEVREIPAEPTAASAQPDQGSGARTYRVFTTHNNQTVGTFQSDGIHGSTNASIAFRNYLRSIGRESAAGFNYELIGSERPQAAAQQTAAPAADALPPTVPLDIEIAAPRTLTTPGQPQQQFTGNWLVKDADGNILATFSGIGNVQADANRVAMGWLRQNPQYMQDGVEVVPEMSE